MNLDVGLFLQELVGDLLEVLHAGTHHDRLRENGGLQDVVAAVEVGANVLFEAEIAYAILLHLLEQCENQ